ncbi:MAG: trimethylamine methyltransferase family protein [Kiritimatiellae bacterium]|nr:trimethylamine methyltransferase family protein [Kiritimatiellia bacterium]
MTEKQIGNSANISLGIPNRQQIQKIHRASLDILEKTGVRVQDTEACALLRKAGARVDGDRVRLKSALVARALKTTPRSIKIYTGIRFNGVEQI